MLFLLIVNSAPPCHRTPGRQTERGGPSHQSFSLPSSSSPLILAISLTAPSKPDDRASTHPSTHPSSWNQLFHELIIHYGLFQMPDIYFRPQMKSASEWHREHLRFRGWGRITASDLWKGTSPRAQSAALTVGPSGEERRSSWCAAGGWRMETATGTAESRWRSPG